MPASNRSDDPFDLERFVKAQTGCYAQVLAEIRSGRKTTHWMWFIFPQIAGLGSSSTSRYYAIRDHSEAEAYLEHPVLGPRLIECCEAVLSLDGISALQLLGWPDDLKLKSSMTLFALVSPSDDAFQKVLDKFFEGESDDKTIDLLRSPKARTNEG